MPDASYCRQPGLGLVVVSGRDARKFLHAQTTQQIDNLPPQATRLAAWLNAKGRVLALFDVVPAGENFLLVLPADNVAPMIAGLSRYVLRDDVHIERDTGRSIITMHGNVDGRLRELAMPLPRGATVSAGDVILARTGERRIDLIAGAGSFPALVSGLSETDADAAAREAIADGRPELPFALVDRYTPHMLGLERLGAVSFNKGCYPGQEIVARTEHRGTVKRGIRRFRCATGTRPEPGDAIVDAAAAPAGEINRVAACASGFELLGVVNLDAAASGFRLGTDDRTLEALELPF